MAESYCCCSVDGCWKGEGARDEGVLSIRREDSSREVEITGKSQQCRVGRVENERRNRAD